MRIVLTVSVFLVLVLSLHASDSDSGSEDSWSPLSPDIQARLESDWIQLDEGDWLTGEFLSLRDDELFFKSEEFGDLNLDWEDVRELHTSGDVIVVILDGRVVTGRVSVSRDEVYIHSLEETVQREKVISIVPAKGKWWELWNGRISSGLNLRSGNTNQVDFQIKMNTVIRTAFNRFNMNYLGNFSRVEGYSIASNNNAVISWNYFINHKMYIIPLVYDFVSDPFRNIRQQHTPSVGFGYEIMDHTSIEWDIQGGAGYRYLEYSSVEPGQKTFSQSVVLQLGTRASADITDSTEVDFNYLVNFDLINLKNVVQNLSTQFYVDITNNLELDVMFSWSRTGDPEKREDGSLPEKNDLSLTAGVSFEY